MNDELLQFLIKHGISINEDDGSLFYYQAWHHGPIATDATFEELDSLENINEIVLVEASKVTGVFLERWQGKPLKTIKMIGCPVTDSGTKFLPSFPLLETLTLTGTVIADKGVASISNCEKLTYLQLYSKDITDEGFLKLEKLKFLARLETNLPHVSGAAYERLQKELPDCEIVASMGTGQVYISGEGIIEGPKH